MDHEDADSEVLLVLFDLRDALGRMESKLDSALSGIDNIERRVDRLERLAG